MQTKKVTINDCEVRVFAGTLHVMVILGPFALDGIPDEMMALADAIKEAAESVKNAELEKLKEVQA